MAKLGTTKRPIILKVSSEERAREVIEICDAHGWHYTLGFEDDEDISDLTKALEQDIPKPDLVDAIPSGTKKRKKPRTK